MRTLKILTLSVGLAVAATAVTACGITEQECNRNSLGITFAGTVQIENPVKAVVCHGYWNQLDVGTYRGEPTRWWGPIMVYHSWYGDLPIATQECKTYWVRPGTEMRLFASCVDAVITTGAMNESGTYVMTIEG